MIDILSLKRRLLGTKFGCLEKGNGLCLSIFSNNQTLTLYCTSGIEILSTFYLNRDTDQRNIAMFYVMKSC